MCWCLGTALSPVALSDGGEVLRQTQPWHYDGLPREDVLGTQQHLARSDEAVVLIAIHGHQPRHGVPVFGDLNGFAGLHPLQDAAGVLPEFSDAHTIHMSNTVAQCSGQALLTPVRGSTQRADRVGEAADVVVGDLAGPIWLAGQDVAD
ncbi:hypothetical protein BH23ACT9_BH23ACT9_16720 [soil metagenome]